MKKFIYVCILFLASVMARGETGFIVSDNAKKAFTFDNMGTGNRPWGWRIGNTTTHGTVHGRELVSNRYEEADKAVKLTAEVTDSSATWHISVELITPTSSAAPSLPNEVSEFSIPLETDFYYTFWAKSDTPGNKLYIGMTELYSGNFTTNAVWGETPVIELTTRWTKYAVLISKELTTADKNKNNLTALTKFDILFRGEVGEHIQYIDDIELGLGHDLPADVGHYFIDGVEHDANGNIVTAPPHPDFIISDNAKKAFTFDNMSTGNRPWGWRIGNTTSHGTTPGRELVANRYEEADKAVKLTGEITNSSATWHISVELITPDNSAAPSLPDEVSGFSIPLETDFYYTFWAKSEVEGEKLYICPQQVFDRGDFTGADWSQMPATELTTNWTKYAIKISKEQTAIKNKLKDFTVLHKFSILFRGATGTHIQYIDDIEFGLGHNLPADVGHYFINGIEYDADGNPLTPPIAIDQNGQEYDFSTDIPALSSDITSLKLSGFWSSEDYEDLEQKVSNPNCLIYLKENMDLPNTNSSVNYIVGGVALNDIILVDSDPANEKFYPYHCPESFNLGDNSIIYELTNFDFASRANGWNTLAVPFDGVLKIDGIAKTPFSSDDDSAGEYWLKEYIGSNNEEVLFSHAKSGQTIKKNTPYLLAIPGKDAFGENGYETEKVTIEATDISIDATPDADELKQTASSYSFVCNYQITEKADIYVMERGEGSYADSFAQYDMNGVLPFRAYFEASSGSNQVRRLTIGNGGATGFNLIQKDEETMNIYVQGSSVVIESNEATVVKVYSVDGQLVKNVTVEVGTNKVTGLSQGIYIIGGQKVVIYQ